MRRPGRLRCPPRGQCRDRLGVGARHVLDGPDQLEVLGADRRHEGDVGPRDSAELTDLSDPSHPHLGHEHARVALEPADGERQPDLVVLARFGPDRRRHHGAQRGQDVLRRRLPGRPDDGDDARAALPAHEGGKCGQRCVLVVRDERGSTARPCLGYMLDTRVERHEQIAGADEA